MFFRLTIRDSIDFNGWNFSKEIISRIIPRVLPGFCEEINAFSLTADTRILHNVNYLHTFHACFSLMQMLF